MFQVGKLRPGRLKGRAWAWDPASWAWGWSCFPESGGPAFKASHGCDIAPTEAHISAGSGNVMGRWRVFCTMLEQNFK